MAAIGRTARAARNIPMRVAGFRTTSQAGLDRISQPTSVPNVVPAWEDLGVTYSTWYRDVLSAYSRGFATKDGASKTSEEMRVEKKVRDELGEPEGVKDKAKQIVSEVGEKVKDAGKAVKGSTGNQTVDKVGDTVKGAGDTIKDKAAKKQTLGKEDVVTS